MTQHRRGKSSSKPPRDIPDVMIADVPVKISITHGTQTLRAYQDVIDIEFTPHTPEGRTNMQRLYLLKEEEGLSTESAIFTLASDAVREYLQESVSTLVVEAILPSAAQHEIRVHVKRHGTITYRRPLPQEA